MKLALIAFVISFNVYAHQYIQCHNDDAMLWKAIVVSLDEERQKGTLYLHEDFGNTRNASSPFVIKLSDPLDEMTISYEGTYQRGFHYFHIPSDLVGRSFKNEEVRLDSKVKNRKFWYKENYTCFSSIYNEVLQ